MSEPSSGPAGASPMQTEPPGAPIGVEAVSPAAAGAFANYPAALKFLNDRINVEKARPSKVDPGLLKLDSMRALLAALGDPHRSVKCVHIAGSKGKGSTVEMTAACLASCGYAVGVYTSPHLV